ncbi:hypothetical protein [Streptomyces halobius]|uniref:Uncharacterized protein n=1 Tax=Streptomyces halobius TaxID=2879846 RepID=A0ABY4MP12_9ACTN|nr:hypothetical protein [Streptomyces halobius]UQA98171.1 hypothetical protein K9S39_04750 [Streptomyces halobius]
MSSMVDRHEHKQLRGPSTDEARMRLEKFGDRVRFLGKTPNDEQMKKLMARNDPRIYPGRFVTCTDNPARRLCRLPGEVSNTPNPGGCKPLSCRNVALTIANIQAWHDRLDDIDTRLKAADVLAPRARARLEEEREDILAFLTRADASEPAGTPA